MNVDRQQPSLKLRCKRNGPAERLLIMQAQIVSEPKNDAGFHGVVLHGLFVRRLVQALKLIGPVRTSQCLRAVPPFQGRLQTSRAQCQRPN